MTAKAQQTESKNTSNPTTTTKSEMLRVGLVFADWARTQAANEGVTLSQFTDTLPEIIEEYMNG